MDPSKSLTKSVDTVQQQHGKKNENNIICFIGNREEWGSLINSKYKRSGQILFRKTNFKAFAEGSGEQKSVSSDPAEYINGLPWRIRLKNRGEYVGIYLRCGGDPNDVIWSCQASRQFSIVSCTNDKKCFMQEGEFDHFDDYNAAVQSRGYANFATFEEVMDPRNGLYDEKEDAVTFKAEVITEKPKGMAGLRTDDTMMVNGTIVYVNKFHLAGQSEFFKKLFFNKQAEQMPKILIDNDENAVANFERLLSLVNSSNGKVDDECVENILLLANRFLLESVEIQCVNFLMRESKKSAICKFRLAHQCGITGGMKKKILREMTKEDFDFAGCHHFNVLSEYHKLDEEAKKELEKRREELFGNK